MDPLLQLIDIQKSFGGVRALRGVHLDLQPAEVHAIIGENGAGKSTLIKVITGAHAPDAGTIEVDGHLILSNDPTTARTLGIAAIYQQPALFPDLTVAENIALGLEKPGGWRLVRWSERRRRARELLDRVGATLSPDADVRSLSMPQQQLVEIARALGAKARILIMDEPTASLSDREVDNLFRVIGELKKNNVGIIYISHRLEELPKIADRVTVLRDGAWVGTHRMADISRSELIRLMVGREVETIFPKIIVPLGDVAFEARHISCKAGGVRDVSFTVRKGEILGIAGLVGAGRTELARALFGLTPPDTGDVLLDGHPTSITSPADAVSAGLAYVPEDRRRHGAILPMSCAENTTLASTSSSNGLAPIDFKRERTTTEELVQQLNVKTASIFAPVGNLSGGNQQKIALARWLATKPRVLILDEPTQGVDVGAKSEIHRIMGELAKQGLAIIMISSELPEILGMSDRILVMHHGSIVGELSRAEATQERVIELALGHVPQEAA